MYPLVEIPVSISCCWNSSSGKGIVRLSRSSANERVLSRSRIDIVIDRANVGDYYLLATAHLMLGEPEGTMHWLQEAVENRHPFSPWLPYMPTYRDFHEDPRFEALVASLNLPN